MSDRKESRFTKRTTTHSIDDSWRVETTKEYSNGRLTDFKHNFILEGVDLENSRGPIEVIEMPLEEFADIGFSWRCANSASDFIDLINQLRPKDSPRNRVVWNFVKASSQFHLGPYRGEPADEFYTYDDQELEDMRSSGDAKRILALLPPPEQPVSLLELRDGLKRYPSLPTDINDVFIHLEGPFFEATRWPDRSKFDSEPKYSAMYFGVPSSLFDTGFDFVRKTSSFPDAPWDKFQDFLKSNLQPSGALYPRD